MKEWPKQTWSSHGECSILILFSFNGLTAAVLSIHMHSNVTHVSTPIHKPLPVYLRELWRPLKDISLLESLFDPGRPQATSPREALAMSSMTRNFKLRVFPAISNSLPWLGDNSWFTAFLWIYSCPEASVSSATISICYPVTWDAN
jgi:hypothetical protein